MVLGATSGCWKSFSLRHHTHNGSGGYQWLLEAIFRVGGVEMALTHIRLLSSSRMCGLYSISSSVKNLAFIVVYTFRSNDIHCVVSASTEGTWSTTEAFRGVGGETQWHFVGTADLGSS